LGVLVILIAVASNCAQYLIGGSTNFGGMSGVLYGLFGFVWIRMVRQPQEGFWISQQSINIMLVWLLLCFTGLMGNIANWAHLFGLFSGAGLAATLPSLGRHD
jgi:GlpG protein